METSYGLPKELKFCKKCVMPNTRPSSCNEYAHKPGFRHKYIEFDSEGICSACRFNEAKENGVINWKQREEELLELLDKYRSKDGSYDCLVPGSGGKDSAYASHILKYKYKMNPLTVTWAPHLYTPIGWQNFQNWVHEGGFDNYLFTPNGKIHRLITRNAFLNLLHPFQPFIMGQKTFAVKMAARFGIPLVFYGESPGDYGAKISVNQSKFVSKKTKSGADQDEGYRLDFMDKNQDWNSLYLGGVGVPEYLKQGYSMGDLSPFLPAAPDLAERHGIDFYYLGYFLKWVPQDCYYYSVEHTKFQANPVRTEGTYSKYNSIDDKIDGYFYYTTWIKFGYGRATQDAAQEIRNHHITREEGVALCKKFDGELPSRWFKEFLEYVGLSEKEFHETCDKFRPPELWEKVNGQWNLKYKIWEESAKTPQPAGISLV